MRIHHWFIVILWLTSVFFSESRAQQLKASASAQEVAPGEVLQWEILLEGSSGELVPVVDVKPFTVLSGPSNFYNMQFINGRKKVEESWQYTLRAPHTPGTYLLPPAVVKVNGKKMTSNTVSVKVSGTASAKRASPWVDEDQPVQVIWQVGTNESCVGCQVLLEAYIITGVDIATLELLQAPLSSGGYLRELNVVGGSPEFLQIKGKRYLRQLIYRAAFYPQTAGEIRIQPIRVQALIHETSEDARDPFSWFRPSVIPLEVESETLVLKVMDPFSLSGAIRLNACGDFSVQEPQRPDEASVGEALTWSVQVKGYGDPNMVQKPEPTYSNGLTYFPDMAVDVKSNETAKGLLHNIAWSYVFVPKDTGAQMVSLPFHYFDQATGKVKTIEWRDTVWVRPAGVQAGRLMEPESDSTEELNSERSTRKVVTLAAAVILLMLVFAGIYYLVRHKFGPKPQPSSMEPASVLATLNSSALISAGEFEKMAVQEPADAFFKAMRQEMSEILRLKAGASVASATDDAALAFLKNRQWTDEEIREWASLYDTASAYLYGIKGYSASPAMCWSRYKLLREKLDRM